MTTTLREALEIHGWTKNTFFDHETGWICLGGAVAWVCGSDDPTDLEEHPKGRAWFEALVSAAPLTPRERQNRPHPGRRPDNLDKRPDR